MKAGGVQYVIGYISIGEDVASYTNSTGPIVGHGLGPSYFDTTTNAVVNEHLGVASYYVDQQWNGTTYLRNNTADQNPDSTVTISGRMPVGVRL